MTKPGNSSPGRSKDGSQSTSTQSPAIGGEEKGLRSIAAKMELYAVGNVCAFAKFQRSIRLIDAMCRVHQQGHMHRNAEETCLGIRGQSSGD